MKVLRVPGVTMLGGKLFQLLNNPVREKKERKKVCIDISVNRFLSKLVWMASRITASYTGFVMLFKSKEAAATQCL